MLVEHASNVTAKAQLPDRNEIWRRNGQIFVDKWTDPESSDLGLLEQADPERRSALLEQARTAAAWLDRVLAVEDRVEDWKAEVRDLRQDVRRLEKELARPPKPPPPPPPALHERVARKLRSWGGLS